MAKKVISFEKLLEIPNEDMKMKCNYFIQKKLGLNVYCVELLIFCPNESICREYYSYRNYIDFKELFENFVKRYPEEKFPEFPSRIAFTKAQEETRMKYFQMFLNKILEGAKDEDKTEDYLNILYNFVFEKKDALVMKLTKEIIKLAFNKDVPDSEIIDVDDNDTNEIDNIEEMQNQSNSDINNNSAQSFTKTTNFLDVLEKNILPTLDKIISPEDNKDNNSVNLNLSCLSSNESNKNNNMNNSVNNNINNNSMNTNINNSMNNSLNNINNNINENNNKPAEKEFNFNIFKRNTINYVNEKFNLFLGNKDKEKEKKEKEKEKEKKEKEKKEKEKKEKEKEKKEKEKKEKENKEKENKETKGIFDGIRKTISSKKVAKYVVENNAWENILVKTSLKDYSLHKIKLKEKCLFLSYEKSLNYNINDESYYEKESDAKINSEIENKENDFYMVIPLYKINIELYRVTYPPLLTEDKTLKSIPDYYKKIPITLSEIYEFENFSPTSYLSEINSEIIMKLYHDYDRFETFIKFGKDWIIGDVRNCIAKIEDCSIPNKQKSIYIDEVIESNMDSFGNIMIDIINFSAPYFKGKIKIKICLDPYTFTTKAVISNASFDFNQKFMIPKHNRFKYLKFYIYKTKEGGIINKKDVDKLISEYEIPLPKLINIYHLNKDPIEINLKPTKEKAKKKKLKYTNMILKFKCIDYSSLLAILVKNTNKRVSDCYPLYDKDGDSEEPFTITILLKRIKRVLYMFKDIYSFYQMLKFFKYPVISSLFWLVLVFYTFLCDPRYYMTHTVVFIISILFYYSSVFQNYLYPKLKPLLFSIRNKYDNPSKLAATESQKNKEEVAQSDYLIKKKGGFFIPSIKEIKEYKHTYIDLLFRLTRICAFCEKFKNLFLWTDPLLSFYMMVLLIFFVLITWKIELRFLVCFSVSKKLFFGIFYYKNKLINNLEIARIVTNNAFEIWKSSKEKEEKKDKKDKKQEKKVIKITKIMEKKTLDDEKLKIMLKNKLYEHSNIILSEKFFDKMETLGDVIEELGKVQDILKIKRLSPLFPYTKNNPKIFQKDVDPEDIFAYFTQNIKSDYYLAHNGFIKTDYFKSDSIIEEELDIKKNLNKIPNGYIPDDFISKIDEIKQ